ncbi:MAG: hypothetical protein IT299_11115 [Dehalococcoidia bacterium]|nr:hypothetical protein [Dehalococcoidia bacterium]
MTHALNIRDERFTAQETLPAWALMKLAKSQGSGDAMQQVAGLHDFLMAILAASERNRFERFMETRPDVTFEELETAVGALMQAYTTRPTERPSRSPAGPMPSGGSSRVVSLSRGTVREEATSSMAGQPPAS